MASGSKKRPVRRTQDAPAPAQKSDAKAAAGNGGAEPAELQHHEIPRWRKIEILRERRSLREMLDDFGDDDVVLDDEIFGFGEDQDAYFRVAGEEDDEEDEEAAAADEEFGEDYDDEP